LDKEIVMSVIGVDVSKYEVSYIVNDKGEVTRINDWWSPDKSSKPIDFVIQRVSYGGKEDEMLALMYSEVIKVPIRGFYHYYSSGVKWQTQLDTILKAIDGKFYHFGVVDYEKAYNNLNATSFAEMMELEKQLRKTTSLKTLNYFNHDIYRNFMKPYGADKVINNDDGNWIAWYPSIPWPEGKAPSLPAGVTDWKFWQRGAGDVAAWYGYTEGKAYGSWRRGIDVDVWNGTIDELKAWANIESTPDPEPPTPPTFPGATISVTLWPDGKTTASDWK
jgi:hypothetical protein